MKPLQVQSDIHGFRCEVWAEAAAEFGDGTQAPTENKTAGTVGAFLLGAFFGLVPYLLLLQNGLLEFGARWLVTVGFSLGFGLAGVAAYLAIHWGPRWWIHLPGSKTGIVVAAGTLSIGDDDYSLAWIRGTTIDSKTRKINILFDGQAPLSIDASGHELADQRWLANAIGEAARKHVEAEKTKVPVELQRIMTKEKEPSS